MSKRFFNPFVGKDYYEGIRGKKVLVVGASFYCPEANCPYHGLCTDAKKKDSSAFDMKCPKYVCQGGILSMEPSYSIEEGNSTYTNFSNVLGMVIGEQDYMSIWNKVAFTNYVQFFLSGTGEEYRPTMKSDLSERDFDSFIETVKELQPDVVIVWGCVINSKIKNTNEYVFDKDDLPKSAHYLCHMRLPGISKDIAIVNSYHPSLSQWHSGKEQFMKYLDIALDE